MAQTLSQTLLAPRHTARIKILSHFSNLTHQLGPNFAEEVEIYIFTLQVLTRSHRQKEQKRAAETFTNTHRFKIFAKSLG
ncbi:hypothetical protein OAO92_07025 [Paracoccaceae bacterium]|nr:hypothetical protein [Paracoccaceae bacterium]MED7678451.1 hypothetical protein [Rhodobacteraceae bacterium IMCC15231]